MDPKPVQLIPLSELEHDPEEVLRRVAQSDMPAVITREGHAEAVLLGIEVFERSQRERALLIRLARGEREIAAGEGIDLETILAEPARK